MRPGRHHGAHSKDHWETIYRTKETHEVSWFQREANMSLALIRRVAPGITAEIIDVGGGGIHSG